MSVDRHDGMDEIVLRHLAAEGRAAGLARGGALGLLQDMTDRLGLALDRPLTVVGDQTPAPVVAFVRDTPANREGLSGAESRPSLYRFVEKSRFRRSIPRKIRRVFLL